MYLQTTNTTTEGRKMMRNYSEMSSKELKDRQKELCKVLDYGISDAWDEAYKEYCEISAELDERYRKENQSAFDAFYKKHIQGRKWEEIDPEILDTYSDWHKDMYGFRPRHT